jgi:hypothetical protein
MLDEMRRPFFILALFVELVVVLIEVGSPYLLNATGDGMDRPGYGIQYLVFIDGFLLYVSLLTGLGLIIPENIQGRVEGCATLIVSFFGCLGIITAIIFAFVFLLVLISLLLAPIFGTAAYLAIYGHFDRGSANVALGLLMALKIVFCVLLILAHQRFLQSKSLILLTLSSLLGTLIVTFLINFVPGVLASITDALGAIVVGVIALTWAMVFIIGAIVSIARAVH